MGSSQNTNGILAFDANFDLWTKSEIIKFNLNKGNDIRRFDNMIADSLLQRIVSASSGLLLNKNLPNQALPQNTHSFINVLPRHDERRGDAQGRLPGVDDQ